ncbi:MAG: hypothetical protein WC500_06630 [Candidatus Margulisiibacteriota bacterium]
MAPLTGTINFELIAFVISIIVNPLLISGLIIPQSQKINEIKDRLVKFKITTRPGRFQELLDIYALRSEELNMLVNILIASFICTALAVLISLFVPLISSYVAIIHMIIQLLICIFAIKHYIVNPDKMCEIDYIVNKLDINPHDLIDSMGLEGYAGLDGALFRAPSRETPININLSLKLRVKSFRFIYFISNGTEDVYQVALGPIKANTKLWRHRLPEVLKEKLKSDEMNRIEISKFQFNTINNKMRMQFKVTFLFFISFFDYETINPYTLSFLYESEPESINWGAGTGTLKNNNTYKQIKFKGKGDKIFNILTKNETEIETKIIKKYSKLLMKSNKIRVFTSYKGDLLK